MAGHLHRADHAGGCTDKNRRSDDENAGGADHRQRDRHRGDLQMWRGNRKGIREIIQSSRSTAETLATEGFFHVRKWLREPLPD